ncbi:nitroreductase family deazaflavin-dependent oxidoreductase [Tepidiforma sp.]|uniref:nitroreductase family deazaflavin-dependent oxidoreductase n=1 Tax=Tepidiforma sp. TaxID=2682230 RepID=UPI00262B7E54|nr:nitroreductase family deazaflavin-dependent oxidoreductase [Tepidiforma sp.]MCX7617038.1 nitroreductase family deazaflavin-dependent oxidoreductase [Tepidiforma sp.]
MARMFWMGAGRRAANALVRAGLALGLGERNTRLLVVAGRKSGTPMSTPVTLIIEGEQRWLVSPYGERAWVKNLRAAGVCELRRGRRSERVRAREVSAAEAGPVLKRYAERVAITRPYFDAKHTDPVERFIEEAERHPVFALTPAEP